MRPAWIIVESDHRWTDLCRRLLNQRVGSAASVSSNRPPKVQRFSTPQWLRGPGHELLHGPGHWALPEGFYCRLLLLDSQSIPLPEVEEILLQSPIQHPYAFKIVAGVRRAVVAPSIRVRLFELGVHWILEYPEDLLRYAPTMDRLALPPF